MIAHEGWVKVGYVDPVGVPTACAGHTRTAVVGKKYTEAECLKLLQEDVQFAERKVKENVKVKLTQRQYNATVSFVFNVGSGAFYESQFLAKMNAGDCRGAADELGVVPLLRGGKKVIYTGKPLKYQGKVVLNTGDYIKKWTIAGGKPLPGLIGRRAHERAEFLSGCPLVKTASIVPLAVDAHPGVVLFKQWRRPEPTIEVLS